MRKYGKVAALAAVAAIAAVPTYSGVAEGGQKTKCSKKNPKKCPTVKKGRFTGHGHFTHETYGRVQWEFRNSVCNANRFPDLKVAWGDNKFRLTAYSEPLRCVDFPGITEEQPRAGFDSIIGEGTGTLNGEPAFATFKFTDAGEPGRNDLGTIRIVNDANVVVLDFSERRASGGGNHQAHRK
jgi:hypothetical protein